MCRVVKKGRRTWPPEPFHGTAKYLALAFSSDASAALDSTFTLVTLHRFENQKGGGNEAKKRSGGGYHSDCWVGLTRRCLNLVCLTIDLAVGTY